MKLSKARQGKQYAILKVSGEDGLRRRLLDMGFTPGSNITVSGVAPFKGAVLVTLRGFCVALREEATEFIEVGAV